MTAIKGPKQHILALFQVIMPSPGHDIRYVENSLLQYNWLEIG